MNNIIHSLNLKHLYCIGFIIILCYYIPFLILGKDSYIFILDYLDPYLAHFKMLKENGVVFDYSKSIPVMCGLERSSFDLSNWVITFFYTFNNVFWGIIINDFLVKVIAFIGMFELLRNYIITKSNKANLISFICALCFAFIPFYSIYGISSAGIPLLLYAFFNLYNGNKSIVSYFLIVLYCLYSHLILSGLFIGFVLTVTIIYRWIKDKKLNRACLGGLITMGIIYAITNYKLFESFFVASDFISHRVEFAGVGSFRGIIKQAVLMFCESQLHAGLLFTIPILALAVYAIIIKKKHNSLITKLFFGVIIIIGFWFVYAIAKLYMNLPSFLMQFQIDRFYFFLPTIWILILALSVELLFEKKYYWIITLTVILLLGGNFALNKECTFYANKWILNKQDEPTYKQFIDTKLFTEIDKYIGKDKSKYKIVSIGMLPSPAQYNNFYCLDGYWNNYPLEYKHKFRKIIAPELDKSDQWKTYFDNWGSRCYIYSSELSKFCYGKSNNHPINNLDLNIPQLKSMGCEYVFSAMPILNYQDLGLRFEKSFTTEQSFWKIYLYSL